MQGYDYIINAILAAGIAIIISIAMGPFMIPFEQTESGAEHQEDGPQRHLKRPALPPWVVLSLSLR